MSNQLIKYEAACRALAECKSVDEAKSWADKAAAMQAYGRMAKDKTLEVDAAEIRIRAERRLGEMLAAQKADGGLNHGTRMAGNKPGVAAVSPAVVADDHRPTLAQSGISKDLSSRAQKLAAVPVAEFEAELAAKRERDREDGARVSSRLQAVGERAQQKAKNQAPASQEPEYTDLDAARDQISDLQHEVERLSDRLAAEAIDASEEEKTAASETIATLRAEVKTLTAHLEAVTIARDTLQEENAQLKRQCQMYRGKLDKMEKAQP